MTTTTDNDMLNHYMDALDEVYRLRTALAYEAQVLQVHLSYATFPKTRRVHAEDQVGRMLAAARGQAEATYAGTSSNSLEHVRREAGMGKLTRSQWEAR